MAVLKCKMCGGNLKRIEGSPFAVCESCGTEQTYPKIDSDELTRRYNRGNEQRAIHHAFDNALNTFQEIIVKDEDNADAYWQIMLCRYGVTYQEDPYTYEQIPNINRIQTVPVTGDPDYQRALLYCDPSWRSYYEEEAEKIEKIRAGFVNVMRKEEPYDVFICFKSTDSQGNKTNDSVYGRDLYTLLTDNGFKVFFSDVTLRDRAVGEYEPYIYAALNTAKILFLIGTKAEYMDAPWVRNEWSRYKAMHGGDVHYGIVPLYNGDLSIIPAELKSTQCRSLRDPGWHYECLRLVNNVLGSRKQDAAAAGNAGLTVGQLYEAGTQSLYLGEIETAKAHFEAMSRDFPGDYRGWWGLFMIETDSLNDIEAFRQPERNEKLKRYIANIEKTAEPDVLAETMESIKQYLRKIAEREAEEECMRVDGYLAERTAYLDAVEREIEQNKNDIDELYREREGNLSGTRPDHAIDQKVSGIKLQLRRTTYVKSILLSIPTILLVLIAGIEIMETVANGYSNITSDSRFVITLVLVVSCVIGGGKILFDLMDGIRFAILGGVIGLVGSILIDTLLIEQFPMVGKVMICVITGLMILLTIYSIAATAGKRRALKASVSQGEIERMKAEEAGDIQAWYDDYERRAGLCRERIAEMENLADTLRGLFGEWERYRSEYGDIVDCHYRKDCGIFHIGAESNEDFDEYRDSLDTRYRNVITKYFA